MGFLMEKQRFDLSGAAQSFFTVGAFRVDLSTSLQDLGTLDKRDRDSSMSFSQCAKSVTANYKCLVSKCRKQNYIKNGGGKLEKDAT